MVHADRLLETVIRRGGSEMLLMVGEPPLLRLDGRLRRLQDRPLTPRDTRTLMEAIAPDVNLHELQQNGVTEFGIDFGTMGRFAVEVSRQNGNIGLALRLIP